MPFMYRLGKIIISPIFKLYYHPKIIGEENIPREGAMLIVGNHKHLFDQCLPIISTKRYIKYMAKKEYFENKKIAWFFKACGCIPIDRSKKNPDAVKEAIEVLNSGGAIGLFPEGTRNKTKKKLLPFKYGTVSMAAKTGALIVPFAITGDYVFHSKNLCIRYGESFKIENMSLPDANKKLYNEVNKLMEVDLHGEVSKSQKS